MVSAAFLIYVQHLPHFNVNPLLAGKFTINNYIRFRGDHAQQPQTYPEFYGSYFL